MRQQQRIIRAEVLMRQQARLDRPVRVAGLRRARKQTWCYRGWFYNDLVKSGGERPAEDR